MLRGRGHRGPFPRTRGIVATPFVQAATASEPHAMNPTDDHREETSMPTTTEDYDREMNKRLASSVPDQP